MGKRSTVAERIAQRAEARRLVLVENQPVAAVARAMQRSTVWVYRQLDGDRPEGAKPWGWKTREMVRLARSGISDEEIAEVLDSTPTSVAATLSHQRRLGVEIPHRSERGVYVRLPAAAEASLLEEAASRDLTPSELAAKILTAVITDSIYDAVIDEDRR